ncbi:hypothetical protein ACOSQ2_007325 [Xanthoceras sorbifolium]
MAKRICEGIWLKCLLAELKVPIDGSIMLLSNSQTTVSIAKDPIQHDRTEHIEIDKHFIKENIEMRVIEPIYTPSSLQKHFQGLVLKICVASWVS